MYINSQQPEHKNGSIPGVVLYVVLVGKLPFDDRHLLRLFKKIMQGQFEIPIHLSKDACDLLKRTLCTDPENRITIEELKKHPWVAKGAINRLI